MDDIHDDRLAVYEIGYLIVSSIPEEGVVAEAEKVKKIISDAGASFVADELPHKEHLAYTMRRKTVSGSYEKYDDAYFGWVKFELGSDKVEAVKAAVTVLPSVLRMLLISTVKENTYLGKRAAEVVANLTLKRAPSEGASNLGTDKAVSPATMEEMDKSIDDMVKTL